jgi:dihydroflavonol-4-reductase
MSTQQIAFVTGATGFVGRFLLLELLKNQHQVFALMRDPNKQGLDLREWLKQRGVNDAGLSFIQGDLALPDLGITVQDWQAMREVNVLYNTGALFAWGLNKEQARQINVTAAANVLKLTAQHCQLIRAVHVSGYMLTIKSHLEQAGVNISNPEQTHWDLVYQKLGAYEASKIEAHYAWMRQAEQQGTPWTIIHPATAIGDVERGEIASNQAFYSMLSDLKQGRFTAIPGSIAHYIPLVSVSDLAQIMRRAATETVTMNQEILVADAQTPSLTEVLAIVAQQLQVKAPTRYVPLRILNVLLKWSWLAKRLHLSAETLHFIRTEKLDTSKLDQLRLSWEIKKPDLKQTIQKTADLVNRH